MRKGQVEIVVILGLLVVIAVVVVSQMNIFAPNETTDSRLARESVESFVRLAAYDTVDKMSMYGGYVSPSDFTGDYETVNGKPVPYWQQGGVVSYPDKTSNFMKGIKNYIDDNKDDLTATMNNVTLGDPVISAPIFNNDKITVTVAMPTVIRGVPYNQPYIVTIPTRFSEVYEFSKNFAQYEATERPLEYFTLSSMFLSPLENGFHEIPYSEMAVSCGQHLFASSMDIRPKVENAIMSTLAYTYMPGRVPLNTLRTASHPKYSLTPIDGNSYPNIDISFDLPDYFELVPGSMFQMDPSTVSVMAEPIPFTGECISNPVDVNYFIRYPAIVKVKDPETNNLLQFAIDVYIKDNLPGGWASVGGYESTEQKQVCDESLCEIDMTVTDLYGNPVSGATVKHMGCFVGKSDSDGKISGLGPCGQGMLRIYASGYDEYKGFAGNSDLNDKSFALRKRVPLNFIFYEVIISDSMGGGYFINANNLDAPGVVPLQDDHMATLTFYNVRNDFQLASTSVAMSYDVLVEDVYAVSGMLLTSDMTKVEGAFADEIAISHVEGKEGQTVYVYIPKSVNFNGATTDTIRRLTATYTGVMQKCGIDTMTTEKVNLEEACAVESI